MKQFALLFLSTAFLSIASLWWTPYAGVALYYFYAILRPQYLWKFQLDPMPLTLPWSFIVASCAIGGYVLWSAGFISYGKRESSLMRYRPMFTVAHWLMMLFAAWVSMSFLLSKKPELGELWYGEYLKIFGMYYLASRVVRTPTQLWGLYLAIVVAIGYISWEANMIYISTGQLVLYKRGFAGLDNNGAALMLCLGVPLCYFAWEATRGWYRWLYLLVIPVIIHAVLGTYSRGAMLSMIAASPFYFVFSQHRKFLFVVAGVVVMMLPFMAGKEIQDRFFSIKDREVDASYQSRVTSWTIAGEIAYEYPIFGVGIRNSGAEMKERGADMEGRTIHSQYLQLAADSGAFCLVVYMSMLAATFYCIYRAADRLWGRTDFESRRARAMLGGVTCGIVSFMVGGLALSLEVFEIAYLLLFIAAQVWGMLNATDSLVKQEPMRPMASGWVYQQRAAAARGRPTPPPGPSRGPVPPPQGHPGRPRHTVV